MTRAIVVLAALLIGGALAVPASAQESATPRGTPSPSPAGGLLFKLTEPGPSAPPDSVMRDDLRELPRPRPDRLPDNVRITVSDPRCLPGEDPLLDPGWARPAPRRR